MKYLFATDGSPVSNKALENISKMYKNNRDELVIISVAHPEINLFSDSEHNAEIVRQITAKQGVIVEQATRLASDTYGLTNVRGEVLLGDPREQIVSYADRESINVIALGARGLGVIQRLLIGSVSSYVLKNADCHVLIAKV